LLKARDVAVTNQTDKDLWLQLIFELDTAVKNAFTLGQAEDLCEKGEMAAELRKAGFTAKQLKEAGYNDTQLFQAGFNAMQLKDAGYNLTQLKEVGYNATQLKEEGCSLKELRTAGYSARELGTAGCSLKELRLAGYSLEELSTAGYSDCSAVFGLGWFGCVGCLLYASMPVLKGLDDATKEAGSAPFCWLCCVVWLLTGSAAWLESSSDAISSSIRIALAHTLAKFGQTRQRMKRYGRLWKMASASEGSGPVRRQHGTVF